MVKMRALLMLLMILNIIPIAPTISPCDDINCKHGGTCFEGNCVCPDKTTGMYCEVLQNPCEPNPCYANGNCSKTEDGYICECPEDFTGTNCDVLENPCEPNLCYVNGNCSKTEDGYICECPEDFTGTKYTVCYYPDYQNKIKIITNNVDLCEDVECMNGGNCVVDGVCNCAIGFSGPTCNIDLCENVECMNGGNCVGDGVCNCTFGFGGPKCNMRLCDVTQCNDIKGVCTVWRCTTDENECGGKQCNVTNGEICLDNNCVVRNDNCFYTDDVTFQCNPQGEQCGDGFCSDSFAKCLNNTCRIARDCNGKINGSACNELGIDALGGVVWGTCSDGFCLEPCQEDIQCHGWPCLGGFCAGIKCGDSECMVI